MSRKLHHEQTFSKLIHTSVFQLNVVHKRNPAGTGTDLQGIRMDLIPLSPPVIHTAEQTKSLWPGNNSILSGLGYQRNRGNYLGHSETLLTLGNYIFNIFSIQLTNNL